MHSTETMIKKKEVAIYSYIDQTKSIIYILHITFLCGQNPVFYTRRGSENDTDEIDIRKRYLIWCHYYQYHLCMYPASTRRSVRFNYVERRWPTMESMFCACSLSMPVRLHVYGGELEYILMSQSCATGVQPRAKIVNFIFQ